MKARAQTNGLSPAPFLARALDAKARGLHADWLLAEALLREAAPLARAHQKPQAYAGLNQAREICQRLGDRECGAFSRRDRGTIIVGARDAILEVLALTIRNQDQFGVKMETLNLAGVLLSLGDLEGAAKRYESALDLSRKIGESEGEADSLVGVQYTEAAPVARRASNLYSLTGATDAIANAYLVSHPLISHALPPRWRQAASRRNQ
jgi:tetratricopeptide (TPR) repeat protein